MRSTRPLIALAVTGLSLLALTGCAAPAKPAISSPAQTTIATSSPAAAPADLTTPQGVAAAWLAAFNNHDSAQLAALGTTGTPSNLKDFQKAAALTDNKPIISNINITSQEKSFFDNDTHKAVDVKFTYAENGKNYKGKLTMFQTPGSTSWQVFAGPLVYPSASYDSSNAGAYKAYVIKDGTKTLIYTVNAKGTTDYAIPGLFPGTYTIEQDGPGSTKKTSTETYLLRDGTVSDDF